MRQGSIRVYEARVYKARIYALKKKCTKTALSGGKKDS